MSLPLLHAGRTNPGLSAALDLRFALDKSLTAYRGPTPSFSRASTGSYFDGSGVLRYANVNIQPYSEQFSSWSFENSSVTSDVTVAPDGKTTADKVYETSATGEHNRNYNNTAAVGTYTLSFYIKPAGRNWAAIYIYHPSIGRGHRAWFDVQNGTVGTTAAIGSGLTGVSSGMVSAGNGWYRCWLTATTAATDLYSYIGLAQSNGGATNYAGDGSSGSFVWGAQLEASSTVGTYCPTTPSANSAPRFDHTFNGTSWVSRGLLVEEQRTNICLYSNPYAAAADRWGTSFATLTPNAVISPDGTQNATSVVGVNSAPYFQTYYYFNQTSGTYTQSFFLKSNGANIVCVVDFTGNGLVGWYDLLNGNTQSGSYGGVTYSTTITNVGSGWYRCTVTNQSSVSMPWIHLRPVTAMGGTTNLSGNGVSGFYVYGVQAEAGSFATSLISTNGSATTRSADVCQITGSDFSGFWNGAEGSFAVEYDRLAAVDSNFSSGYPRIVTAVKTSDTSRAVTLFASQSPSGEAFFVQDGTVQAWFSAGSLASANVSTKLSTGYKANDFAASLNGAAVATDTSGTIPSGIDRMDIGNEYGVTRFHNGHIARLRYYRKRLPNATLQLLSEPDPTLNLQFALNKTLTPVAGPAPSFSRASTGSYFDSTGTLKYSGFNLILRSQELGVSPWSNTDYAVTSATGPDGASNAQKLVAPASNASRRMEQSVTGTAASYTFSFYAKSAGWNFVQFCNGWSGSDYVNFDLSNGIISNSSGAVGSISSVGNGWYRCSATFSALASTQGVRIIPMATSIASRFPNTTGDGVNGILVFGVQLELGSFATTYAPTTSAANAGPRFDHVYSGGQWVSRGLLIEEQRTNLIQYSEDISYSGWTKTDASVSVNSGIAPDGNMTADKLVENTASGVAHRMYYPLSMGTSSSFSAFFKAAGRNYVMMMIYAGSNAKSAYFDILNGSVVSTNTPQITAKVDPVGNGWFRCSVTYSGVDPSSFVQVHMSPNGITDTYNGDGTSGMFIWGLQAENNVSFPTSYIPTTSSSVTRSADVCQITGTSFGSMWNQGEGSVAVEAGTFSDSSYLGRYLEFTRTSSVGSPSIGVGTINSAGSAGGDNVYNYVWDSSTQAALYASPARPLAKSSFAWKVNDFAASINGATALTDTSGTIPTGIDVLTIGSRYGSLNIINGHIAKIIYYPARLTNTKLQQLST